MKEQFLLKNEKKERGREEEKDMLGRTKEVVVGPRRCETWLPSEDGNRVGPGCGGRTQSGNKLKKFE